MANELQQYSSSAVYINSSQLTENADVTVERDPGFQRVLTIAKGFAGVSPGARFAIVTIRNAVPAVGFEFDPGDAMEGLIPVSVQVFAADATFISTGFVERDTFKHAVNSEAMQDLSLVCQFGHYE
jgi:hypothetical protein